MKTKKWMKPDAEKCVRAFGCTIEQAKRMFAKNATAFGQMAEKAEKTGKNVSGYTVEELRLRESEYRIASTTN